MLMLFMRKKRNTAFWESVRFCLLSVIAVLFLMAASSATAHAREPVRPNSYRVEIYSSHSDNKPRMVNVWAIAKVGDETYRALMPADFIRGKEVQFDFRWSAGSHHAGTSEKVEMQWRRHSSDLWQSSILGEGFRDPVTGQLIVLPAQMQWATQNSGPLSLRFLLHAENGQTLQDGGPGSELQFQLSNRAPTGLIQFSDQWSTGVRGELIAGETFEIEYSLARMEQQFSSPGDGQTPWCLLAKIQFDDGPIQTVSLLATNPLRADLVVPFIPTLSIPRMARRMTLWFVSFHNSVNYFDSNFGANYHFAIRQP